MLRMISTTRSLSRPPLYRGGERRVARFVRTSYHKIPRHESPNRRSTSGTELASGVGALDEAPHAEPKSGRLWSSPGPIHCLQYKEGN